MPWVKTLLLAALAAAPPVTRYTLVVRLDPAQHRIAVEGTVERPSGRPVAIHESRTIDHPIAKEGEDYARGFAETEGTIRADGVFLSGASKWYPAPADGTLVTFDLTVTVPAGWDAVSQGRREILERGATRTRVRFTASEPQEEIWLVAGPWIETGRSVDGIETLAFLREKDEALTAKYLDATGPYIAMYGKLLGAYPSSKFALVENFWETGYGMPSFTLLGSKVIRLPFILTSSYPHEILHNWWGNGVYVDPKSGNWSEGLTAYLADHLFAEQKGGGAGYRQEALQKYADYASKSKDFPLADFRERHSPSTEAVGYGKALMLFHMMRRELGDDAFVKGLRALYAGRKFQRASFDDVRRALESASGRDLRASFTPWVTRTGAPQLRAHDVSARRGEDGSWRLAGKIEQVQAGEPYALAIPIAVTLEGRDTAMQLGVQATERETSFVLTLPARPLRLDVDPEFDLFRRLDVEEAPPALSGAFGADLCTMILPAKAENGMLDAYRAMAAEWNAGRASPMKVVNDDALTELPNAGSIWVVGFENRFAPAATEALAPYGAKAAPDAARARALVARRAPGQAPVIAFVAADHAAQVAGLTRKLPHYHKYSYLAFEGDEPINVDKGRWPVSRSPMSAMLEGTPSMAKLAPREPLAELPPAFSAERMMTTVSALSAPEMKGRGLGTPEIDRAAALIAAAMKDAGLEVLPADPERNNVTGVVRGTKPEWAGSSVVVGAHYDHLGVDRDGIVHPGADDNASGVAVLLELARQMAASGAASRSVVFVAFTGEESGLLGSKRYVSASSAWPASKAIGMVNLDTVGRLNGGKVLVLGSSSASEWIHIVNGAGYVTGAPVEPVMSDPGGSDQKSFIEIGVPAVQVFTGANADYHQAGDTADKIDGPGLVKVAAVTRELVAYLAERDRPLTSTISGAPTTAAASPSSERRVSLGTIPDYAFAGPGVRISGTTPGSPAEKAGLKEGDVLVRLGDAAVLSMRDFSEALKGFAPGARVTVTYQRDAQTHTTEATLVAR
jgi:peptidase M28-like protein/PDZ domain-containing protein/peptidase M1-like protein